MIQDFLKKVLVMKKPVDPNKYVSEFVKKQQKLKAWAKRTVLIPEKGSVYNRLQKGRFRNKLCPCMSGEKVKKCHGEGRFVKPREEKTL